MSPDSSTPTQVVRRYLIALVEQVCRRPWLVVTVAVGLAIASLLAAFTHLHYQTSRDDLVSGRKEYKQRWDRYVAEFGEDDDIVVVVQGEDRERMKQAVDAVAGRLASHPLLFDRLFHKVDLRPLRDRALLLAPMDKVQTIHGEYLADMKRLLDFGPISWHTLGVHPMVQEARQRLADIRPNDKLSRSDERFLAQLGPIARAATEAIQDPRCYRNPWGGLPGMDDQRQNVVDEPQYFFSGDQTLAFLLARPVKEAGSFTGARKSVATAREIVNEVQPNFPDLRLGLTGLPVLETDEMVAAETDTRLASYLAIAGVSLLFLLVYRSIAYPLLTVATLLVGTAWAFGWLTLTVGHLNILSATFAVMLIGMGDYGVLWVIRYEQARQGGMEVREALLHTTEHVAIGNLTAASTLALAFFAALFADFKAVGELGWIAGCGVLLCAFACFTFLPAMLTLFDRRGALSADPERAAVVPCSGDLWLPWLRRHPGVVLATGLTAALSLAACAVRVRYDHNLLNLQADNLDSVKWERTLIDHTAGASWHSLSYCGNVEETQALAERFKRLPEVSQVVEVASLVPADQKAKLPLLADIQKQLTRLPQRGTRPRHATPDIRELRSDLEQLNRTLADRTGDSQLLRELLAEMRKLARTLEDSAPDTTADRLRVVDERLSEDLASGLHRLRDVSTPRPISLADLPPSVRERYVGHNGSFLLRVFAREDLWDFPPLEEFTRKIQAVDPEATGKPFSTVEGLKAMKNGLQRAGIYAFLVILLVLWIDFREFKKTVLAVIPLLLGVVMSVGVLGLLGRPLNPANMIAFPLILGVGVDNGVHVLHDYLIRRRQGLPGISRAIGRGVLVKALTTMIGFASLMISTERGLAGLGFILTLGVGCSMVSALILLPAALEWRIRRRERVQGPATLPLPRRAAA